MEKFDDTWTSQFIYLFWIDTRTYSYTKKWNETHLTWKDKFLFTTSGKKKFVLYHFSKPIYVSKKSEEKEANKMKIADGKFYSRTQYNKFVVYGYGSYFLGLICFFSLHIWLCLHLFFWWYDTEKLNGKFITWWKLFIYMCYLSS